jgi:hypothetical protein
MVLREALLSYLTLYGEEGCLDFKSFKILFQPEEDDGLEWEDVRFLDLTGVLSEDFSLSDLGKCLKHILVQIPEDLESQTHGKKRSTTTTTYSPSYQHNSQHHTSQT